jgi:hypothetical protein
MGDDPVASEELDYGVEDVLRDVDSAVGAGSHHHTDDAPCVPYRLDRGRARRHCLGENPAGSDRSDGDLPGSSLLGVIPPKLREPFPGVSKSETFEHRLHLVSLPLLE